MRLSVTDLDQYRIWVGMEDAGPEWLIDRLTTFEPTPAMAAGSALHKCLETATGDLSVATVDGITFNFDLDATIVLTNIRELKIVREVIPGIILVGKIDMMLGRIIRDYKATKAFDAENYTDSFQWRAYLDLFECDTFEYSIFEIKEERTPNLYTVRKYHSLTLHTYPGIHEDVMQCVASLAAFVRGHNIESKLIAKSDEMTA